MTRIQKIRQKILDRAYYLSSHTEDEMLDDRLERRDIENAIFKGRIQRKLSEDIRGIRYRIEGPAEDGRLIHVVCRFKKEKGRRCWSAERSSAVSAGGRSRPWKPWRGTRYRVLRRRR